MGEGMVPLFVGYLGRFGRILGNREFFKALRLCYGIVEDVLESAGAFDRCCYVRGIVCSLELHELCAEA